MHAVLLLPHSSGREKANTQFTMNILKLNQLERNAASIKTHF